MHATIGGCAPSISMLPTSLLGRISYTFLIFPHIRVYTHTSVAYPPKLQTHRTELQVPLQEKGNPVSFWRNPVLPTKPFCIQKTVYVYAGMWTHKTRKAFVIKCKGHRIARAYMYTFRPVYLQDRLSRQSSAESAMSRADINQTRHESKHVKRVSILLIPQDVNTGSCVS
jgi:hypothetical protein